MTRRQDDAALAMLILALALAVMIGIIYVRSGRDAAPPEERCPIVEYGYSPPVTMAEAVASGRPSDGGRYALRDCGTGVLVREWLP